MQFNTLINQKIERACGENNRNYQHALRWVKRGKMKKHLTFILTLKYLNALNVPGAISLQLIVFDSSRTSQIPMVIPKMNLFKDRSIFLW